MEIKPKKRLSFRIKITGSIMLCFTIVLAVISVLFYHTTNKMRGEAIYRLEYSTREIGQSVDEIIQNIYGVSDAFALDDKLSHYTNGDYSDNPIKKRRDIVIIVNSLFESYNFLQQNEKMAAYYTSDGNLFDFLDPNINEEECKKELAKLDINNSKNLAKFHWYRVQNNFLKTSQTGNIRKDMAVLGSRRVFSRLHNAYEGVHIFALDEETLYQKYKDTAEQYGADVYIVDEDGTLFSSSNEDVLKEGYISDELADKVINQKYDRIAINNGRDLVTVNRSDVNGWITIMCTPMKNITATVDSLQKWIVWIIILCGVFSITIVIFLYGKFISPVSLLSSSMQKVHNGDLTAYVDIGKRNDEMSDMIEYYNSMLRSINQNMEQKLYMEQHKKELEMEGLMNQINPHFLYNTLETIVWKSSEAGRPDIGRLAASLGRMYRLSVSQGKLFISLKSELEHVMAYIKIQESRYDGKLKFKNAVIDREEAAGYYTLKIILQPLVENAINHAMTNLDRVLKIKIKVDIKDDFIKIRVIDNGIGMTKEDLQSVREKIKNGPTDEANVETAKSTGIGLHNICDRLKIYFGIEDGIRIYSKYNIGTVVELRLPKITKAEAEERNKNKNL